MLAPRLCRLPRLWCALLQHQRERPRLDGLNVDSVRRIVYGYIDSAVIDTAHALVLLRGNRYRPRLGVRIADNYDRH